MLKQNGNKGRRFDRAFKEEAVRLLQTSGRRQRQIAGDLGISVSALGRWVTELREEDLLSGPHEDAAKEITRAVGAVQHQFGVAALDGVTRTGEPMTRIASTHVFVDGNNVMGSRPDGWWRDRSGAARRLIAELDPVARRCGGEWMIVFDGLPSLDEEAEPASPLCVDYALRRGANAADDRIVELVAALPEGRNVLVYTSDHRLRERVSALGAQVRGAGVLRRLAGASRVDRDPVSVPQTVACTPNKGHRST